MFFLLPLGFIGYGWGPKALWPAVFFAVIGNSILILFAGFALRVPGADLVWDILYFAVTSAVFAWIILPFDEKSLLIPGAYRLAIGAMLCTIVFIGLFVRSFDNPYFFESVSSQVDLIAAFYRSGSETATQAESINTEAIVEVAKEMILRGGALFASVVMLFINRQLSVFLIRIFGGPRRTNVFLGFRVYTQIIWVFLISISLVLVSNTMSLEILGIIAWNTLILCIMMYLAQGFGIIKYLTSKPAFPVFMRFLLPVVFVFLLFSPGINALLLGAIVLLGLVENWVSLRSFNIPKANDVIVNQEPPSTPEA